MLLRFVMLPGCLVSTVASKECPRSAFEVGFDLLYIFFRLRYYPDNYGRCRLWERPRDEWIYYFGSTYHPWARQRLRRDVQPYDAIEVFLDKARCDDHFRRHGIPMPSTLGSIGPGDNVEEKLQACLAANARRPLIMKPTRGTCGRDVYVVEGRAHDVAVRNTAGDVPLGALTLREGYLVQEYVTQHGLVSRIFPHSLNTIRVVVLLTTAGAPLVLGAYMRMGTGVSIIDNVNAGGVAVGIDIQTGRMTRYAYDKGGRRHERHPDTGVIFDGLPLPHWDAVLDVSCRAQRAVPFYKLIGLDVAITEAGPVVIEVNANPDIVGLEQKCGPLLRNRRVLTEFGRHGLLFNEYQRALVAKAAPDVHAVRH